MELALQQFLEDTVRAEETPKDSLTVMNGPEDGRVHPLTKDLTTIGRLDSNDVALQFDLAASRSHARIVRETGGYFVEDLGSTHGTEVDGARVAGRAALRDGGLLLVGETLLRARLRGGPLPGAPQ
jgi:pSer/pThr/pTyr-binding forkhead associated (FHA) protein